MVHLVPVRMLRKGDYLRLQNWSPLYRVVRVCKKCILVSEARAGAGVVRLERRNIKTVYVEVL